MLVETAAEVSQTTTVDASSPGRLHFGLFNESGLRGRIDGGAGLALQDIRAQVSVSLSDCQDIRGADDPETRTALAKVARRYQSEFDLDTFAITLLTAIPAHKGLGSKTSLLMSTGTAIAALFHLDLTYQEIARLVGRGGTSGVGVHVSGHGGIVVDAGRDYPAEKQAFAPSSASPASAPELRIHRTAPGSWRAILLPMPGRGLHGDEERLFFERHCPINENETEAILECLESQLIPSLERLDICLLNESLAEIQCLGLKAREWDIQSPVARAFRDRWEFARAKSPENLPPMCLSSTGTTLFAITADPDLVLSEVERLGIGAGQARVSRIDAEGTRTVSRH